MSAVRTWARQPTTVAGFSGLIGILAALVLHQVTWLQAIPMLAGALASILLPDNSGARAEIESIANAFASLPAGKGK